MGQLGLGMGQGFREGEFVASAGGGGGAGTEVPLHANTLVAYDPSSVVEVGGLLTSWDDRTANGYNIDSNSPDYGAGTPTAPTVVADDDFTTAITFDSDNDHLAAINVDLSSLNGGFETDQTWFMIVKTTTATASTKTVLKAHENGNIANMTRIIHFVDTSPAGEAFGLSDTTFAVKETQVGLDDGVPHLIEWQVDRTAVKGAADRIYIIVDGTQFSLEAIAADDVISCGSANSHIIIGQSQGSDAVAAPVTLGMFMIELGIPSASRLTEIREWARDNMGCVNIA